MQAIIFCGIQASGKTTFYLQHFFNSHVRISMDLLRTRHRERLFLEACLQSQMRFVVDNTNPTQAERARYIQLAKETEYEVVGYFFESSSADAVRRNSQASVSRSKAFTAPTKSSKYQPWPKGLINSTTYSYCLIERIKWSRCSKYK